MPRVGHQHLRTHPLGHRQHVAEHSFLGDQGKNRDGERQRTDCPQRLRMLQAHRSRHQQHHAEHREECPENKRRCGFYPRMAVRMICIGMPVAVPVRIQHQHIGKQVGQGMQSVRHQCLRVRKKTADHLQGRQQHIDTDTHPGALLCGGKTLRMYRFKCPDIGSGLMRFAVIFHFGCAGMHLYYIA